MQAIAPENVHEAVYYETSIAGTHYNYPDHLSEMKTLQDAYKGLFDFKALDWTRTWNKDWKRFVMGPLGPSNRDLLRMR